MSKNHLSLVPPAPQPIKVEAETFAFLRIGDDIFLAHNGTVDLARNNKSACDALSIWTARVVASLPDEGPGDELSWPLNGRPLG